MNAHAYATVIARIHSGAPVGRVKAIKKIAAAAEQFHQELQRIGRRDDLSPRGKAQQMVAPTRAAALALMRARRQAEHLRTKAETDQAAARTKARGTPKATDAEWRSYLRSLPPNERLQMVLNNPDARGPALREPGLSGLNPEHIAAAEKIALRDAGAQPNDADADELLAVHVAATNLLAGDLMKTAVLELNGALRSFGSPAALQQFIDGMGIHPAIIDAATTELDSTE